MNTNDYPIEIYVTREELFEENIEYVPCVEDKSFSEFNHKENTYDSIIEYSPESPKTNELDKQIDLIHGNNEDQSIIARVIQMYQCTLCSYVTPLLEDFLKHHRHHIELTNKKAKQGNEETQKELFLCGQCSAVFNTMDECRDHMIKDHNFEEIVEKTEKIEYNTEENFTHDYDDVEPESDEEVNEDYESWMKPIPLRELKAKLLKKFIYKCSYTGCHYKFETTEKRENHINCHFSTDLLKVRQFKCYECGEELNRWRDCTKHMWKIHKIDIDLLKCPLCNYRSLTSVLIFRHIQIHSTVKGFVCSVCSEVFKQAIELKNHVSTHVDRDGKCMAKIRWYTEKICEICEHKFSNSKTLSKHIKAVHNKIKPFICSVCGFKSARKASLTIHMRQHTGDRPYKCKYCEFKSRDPSCLKHHEGAHDITKQYKCKFCSYGASQTKTLKNHISLLHPKEYKEKICCDLCRFTSINEELLRQHKLDHKSGLIVNEESNEIQTSNSINHNQSSDKPNSSVELSSDSFLPLESTDSLNHDPPLDTGGVTIPATHSEDTQFPTFINS